MCCFDVCFDLICLAVRFMCLFCFVDSVFLGDSFGIGVCFALVHGNDMHCLCPACFDLFLHIVGGFLLLN